jgi:hypothetical protein
MSHPASVPATSEPIPNPFSSELDAPVPAVDPARFPPSPARHRVLHRRLAAIALIALCELGLLALLGTRADLAGVPGSYLLLSAGVPLFAAALALAAGERRATLALVLLLGAYFAGQLGAGAIDWPQRFAAWRWLRCSGLSALLASAPLVIMVVVFRHAFPTQSRRRSALLGAVCGALAASTLRLHCPNDLLLHVLIAHGGPVLLITALAAIVAAPFTRA